MTVNQLTSWHSQVCGQDGDPSRKKNNCTRNCSGGLFKSEEPVSCFLFRELFKRSVPRFLGSWVLGFFFVRVLRPSPMDPSGTPIMAHPPWRVSDLGFEEFWESCLSEGRHHLKLDFKEGAQGVSHRSPFFCVCVFFVSSAFSVWFPFFSFRRGVQRALVLLE